MKELMRSFQQVSEQLSRNEPITRIESERDHVLRLRSPFQHRTTKTKTLNPLFFPKRDFGPWAFLRSHGADSGEAGEVSCVCIQT